MLNVEFMDANYIYSPTMRDRNVFHFEHFNFELANKQLL